MISELTVIQTCLPIMEKPRDLTRMRNRVERSMVTSINYSSETKRGKYRSIQTDHVL